MEKYICIHGHFYQPPRENPWLEEVELQDSAYPYHDWNQRITAECYAPNTASRILDGERRVIDIVSNYSKISFNFGPTLLTWMERHTPDIHEAIVEADRLSRERFSGHGSALAQVYNHMIMPLANERDKQTQVEWGIRDFAHRFGRDPEGMWLPETAVDLETLEILVDHGILFTILAPNQVAKIRRKGAEKYSDVSGGRVDPTTPYICHLPSGRNIVLFIYDGPISQELAFGDMLKSGERFASRLMGAFNDERDWPQLVHVATDGETYGHHHRSGDMALAYCLHHIQANELTRLTIYAEFLEKHSPLHEVEIFENSAWSCAHGVERWRSDCGCNTGMHQGWHQKWRKPLRDSLDQLRDSMTPLYESEAGKLFTDPWKARDEYIEVLLDRTPETMTAFVDRQAGRRLSPEERIEALHLLEMQRHAMFMFTSCGWFFDEISGIETTQVMAYAARTIQLLKDTTHVDLEDRFKRGLAAAPSNIAEFGDGAKVYEMFIRPARLDLGRVGAHFAISSLFHEDLADIRVYCFRAETGDFEKRAAGNLRMAMGRTRAWSTITLNESSMAFTALYFGGHSVACGVCQELSRQDFEAMRVDMNKALPLGDVPELVRLMEKHFDGNIYSLTHLFKDEQQAVINQILDKTMAEVRADFARVLDQNFTTMNFLSEVHRPLPRALTSAAEAVLNDELHALFSSESVDLGKLDRVVTNLQRWKIPLDKAGVGLPAERHVTRIMERAVQEPHDTEALITLKELLESLSRLQLDLNLWKAQNTYFTLHRTVSPAMGKRASEGDPSAQRWLDTFSALAPLLSIKVA
ncbi:DUF3536 domain-containing protein [Desulfocurvibacter africanus]|uniref:DUF3536 domain-containing protein n=1 Tax=Desulfocurvibacter africanus TaxID=873 RepID=UPI002FD95552